MTPTHSTMSESAQQVFALFDAPQASSPQRAALCWALASVIREKRGDTRDGREVTAARMLVARSRSPRCRSLPDILALTRFADYVCDAVDRAPGQLPDAAFPLIVLTTDGSSIVLKARTYSIEKPTYSAYRVEPTGRHFAATLDEADLNALAPGLTLVLLPSPRRRAGEDAADDVSTENLA